MSQAQKIRVFVKIAVKICPVIALLYSLTVLVLTIYINEKVTPVFIFFCAQVYLNWYSVYAISYNAITVRFRETGNNVTIERKMARTVRQYQNANYRFWYCEKCNSYTCKPTQHCILCKKCFHFRDHHCFFLGACILRQNMGNFILFCFYTSLTCLYSLCTLGPYLYENINRMIKTDMDTFNIFLNFCFPIAFIRLVSSRENACILLVIMFDILVSLLCICLVYGTWKFHSCITGKQRYANVSGKQTFNEIFGSYGLSNIIFPYNGLIGTRDINGKYQLKEV